MVDDGARAIDAIPAGRAHDARRSASGGAASNIAWNAILLGAATLTAQISPEQGPSTYRYAISSPQFGPIGTFVRSTDESNGLDRARSQLRIAVRVLGIPVYREQADETEVWKGGRLISFESRSTKNSKPMLVRGELRNGRLAVTTPKGTILAPAGTLPADPWSSRRLGPATVVTIKTGEIMNIDTTGGETERLNVDGVPTLTRHFHVNTVEQPNRWEIWLDPHGVPIKFRSLEHGRTVDFSLQSPSHTPGAREVAQGG